MACYALASLKETIKLEFLQPNHRVSLDDEAPKSLFEKLSSMQAFLSEKSEGGGAVIRHLEIKIRDFALSAEDRIEIQLSDVLLAKHREYQDKLHQTLLEVARDAEQLLQTINKKIINEGVDDDTLSSIHLFGGSSGYTPAVEEIMVGRKHQIIIGQIMLLRTNHEQLVISIFGMAGIGKTTMASRVYGDPLIASNYDIKAWITVSHQYNLHQILCDLLHSMTPSVIINDGSTLFQLKEQLYKILKGKRYFIVLDDVWNTQAFNDIRRCFPNDPCESLILLTTQFKDVVTHCRSRRWFQMTVLDEGESWELFCKRFSLKKYMAPKFRKIAKHVVKLCDGLPKSIVAVAERLSKCNYTLKEWKKAKKEIESLGTLYKDAQYSSKLTLICSQLPQNLKACFLYFATFPTNRKIQFEKLIGLWIAEGFVEPFGHRALEDIAFEYLTTLASKSLVLTDMHSVDYKLKNCYWMNGALHSFCVREAQREGLFCAVNVGKRLEWSLNVLANSCRWLSLRSHKLDYYVFFSSNKPRSCFFFDGDLKMFTPFKLLRTLDLSTSPILESVQLRLSDLVFLRYLSIPQWFEGLDDILLSNQNLQTVIISNIESKHGAAALHLPSKIWELPQLRYLELGNVYTINLPRMDKEHLLTLSWASQTHLGKEVYCKFPNLKNLKIFYNDVFDPNGTHGSCSNPLIIIFENIYSLLRLETLEVIVPVGSVAPVERPMWFVFPPQLKMLNLSRTNLPVKALWVIGQLSMLESLKLENAFCGRVWEAASGGFRKLRNLFLEARNLERWVANATHFPRLEHLVLKHCYCLLEIPRGFVERNICLIKLEWCPLSIVNSFKRIQLEARAKENFFNLSIDGEYITPSNSHDELSQFTNTEKQPEEKD